MDQLIALDSDFLLWLNSFHTPFLDRFMMLFTGRFVWIPMYATILYILFRMFRPKQVLIFALAIGAAIALSDQTVATILRPIFQRLRPANLDNPLSQFVQVVDGYRGGRYGFPSCHGANSFALAVFIALLIPRQRMVWFIFLWTIINCYTRNYLGVHYPGDIIVGASIGTVYAIICFYIARHIAGVTDTEIKKCSATPMFPLSTGRLRRLKVYDTMIITGLATTIILAIIAAIRALA